MAITYDYAPGQIVYLRKYPATDSMAWMNGRPCLIVSEPHNIFNSINIVTFSTQDRPGIRVTFRNGSISKIHPWAVYTVNCNDIMSTRGFVSHKTLVAVQEAIQFHLGFSDKIPKYLLPFKDDYDVQCTDADEDNVWAGYNNDPSPEIIPTTIQVQETIKLPEVHNAPKTEENEETPEKTRKKRVALKPILQNMKDDVKLEILERHYSHEELCEKYDISRSGAVRLYAAITDECFTPSKEEEVNTILDGVAYNFNKLDSFQRTLLSVKMCKNFDSINVKDNQKENLRRFINNHRKVRNICLSNKKLWGTDLYEESDKLKIK